MPNLNTKRVNIAAIYLIVLLVTGCHASRQSLALPAATPMAATPKNIILMIGDGMALSQVSALVYWKGGLENTVFKYFPVVGFHKSHSHDDLVTDSAAGATAFACGHKTDNGVIGQYPNQKPCASILEEYAQQGYGTGIVVTCTATHATPAAFIAHQGMRAFTENIASDYLDTPFDCFIGGGEYYFSSGRPDQHNLKDSLRKRGYIIRRGTNFRHLPLDGSAPFMNFTSEREPTTASAGRSYLPKATRIASEYLKKRNAKGFFLLVEGSQIDWALHANDRRWLQAEMTDFDKAIRQALEFAAIDGETLVIVTGDHECGGFSMPEGVTKKEFKSMFTARVHTAALVPVYAYGPGADLFSGIYDNTAIYNKMQAVRGKNK